MDTQTRTDDERERMRLEGLHVLARIIARHALSHPHLYTDHPGGEPVEARPAGCGATATRLAGKDGAA